MSDDQQASGPQAADDEAVEIEEFTDAMSEPNFSDMNWLAERLASNAEEVDETVRERVPVTWRELLAVVLMIGLGDQTIYFGEGFAGGACFFFLAPSFYSSGLPNVNCVDTFGWLV